MTIPDWTMEHIMSQNSEHANDPEYRISMSSLGNFTLIHKSDNSSISDKEYRDKIIVYSDCSCRLTGWIAKPEVRVLKKLNLIKQY